MQAPTDDQLRRQIKEIVVASNGEPVGLKSLMHKLEEHFKLRKK
jgi:hypothetical protein